jgi:hypothetical protein
LPLGLGTETVAARQAPDARRALQLALGAMWLLDAMLQYQAVMFTRAFGRMLAATAPGNPGVIARPITWDAALIEHHSVLLNTVFATVQLLLGLGIAFRPAIRPALAASVAWSLAVWWFGEGLGGVLTGTASPLGGTPGAVILYALLAVLLWPADRGGASPSCTAARSVGPRAARALWLVLWLSLAYFALLPANRSPQAPRNQISGTESGEPGWLAAIQQNAAAFVAHRGLAVSIALALVAVGVCLPRPAARASVILALVLAVVIWVVAQAFGTILAGGATDPNSGLPLALVALAYWPARVRAGAVRAGAVPAAGREGRTA